MTASPHLPAQPLHLLQLHDGGYKNTIIRGPFVAAASLQILLLRLQALDTSKFSPTGVLLLRDFSCFIRLNLGLVTKSVLFLFSLLKVPTVVRVSKACLPSFSAPIKSLLAASGLHSASYPFQKTSIHHILFLPFAPGISAPSSQMQMVNNWQMKAHAVLCSTFKARGPYSDALPCRFRFLCKYLSK